MSVGIVDGKVYETWQKIVDEWFFLGWLPIKKAVLDETSEDEKYIYATYTRTDGIIDEYRFRKAKED